MIRCTLQTLRELHLLKHDSHPTKEEMVFPVTNTNKHQHTPHLRCLPEEWFHLQSLASPGQSSSCHLAPSSVSWCGSRSCRCSAGARGWSTISSGCWSSAWGLESSGWSWGMAEAVGWPQSQTCPRCRWQRPSTLLQGDGAGETSSQHPPAPAAPSVSTACPGDRLRDLWTLCKLYCAPERGICPAMGISHNLTRLSHFLPRYLSLWKIADREGFYMQFCSGFLWKPDFHAKRWISQLLPTISLWIARKKIGTKKETYYRRPDSHQHIVRFHNCFSAVSRPQWHDLVRLLIKFEAP